MRESLKNFDEMLRSQATRSKSNIFDIFAYFYKLTHLLDPLLKKIAWDINFPQVPVMY